MAARRERNREALFGIAQEPRMPDTRTLSAAELADRIDPRLGKLTGGITGWDCAASDLIAASDHLRRSAPPAEVREVVEKLRSLAHHKEVADRAATLLESLSLSAQEAPADGLESNRIEFLRAALENIRLATIKGKVCDDVAWFSEIETLHDFCAGTLERDANVAAGQQPLPLAEGLAAEFERLAEKATKGPVDFDTIESDGAYGVGDDCHHGFTTYAVVDANGKTIVDALNSDVGEVHVEHDEDGTQAWDQIARQNAAFIAWCFNHRTDIARALKSAQEARNAGLEEAAKWHEERAAELNRIPIMTMTRSEAARLAQHKASALAMRALKGETT